MSFLNAALLGGLAAAAIPLILHLLNRRRFRVVRWGAMPFLEHLLRTNRRRLRLEQILLLLVRTLLPVLLALTGLNEAWVALLPFAIGMGYTAMGAYRTARELVGTGLAPAPKL